MNETYFEELADYMLGHNASAVGKSFGINKIINELPSEVQERIRKNAEQKRDEFIIRLKTDEKFRKRCEDRKSSKENMKCYFGKR